MSRATTGAAVPRSVRRGICCSADQISLPSASGERAQLAVDRAHDDLVFRRPRARTALRPSRRRASARAPLSAASATTWPSAEPTTTRSAPTPVPPASASLVFSAPDLFAGLEIECGHVAVTARREQAAVRGRETEPQAQLLATAAHARAPDFLDAHGRTLDVGELGGLVDFLVLRCRRRAPARASRRRAARLRCFIRIPRRCDVVGRRGGVPPRSRILRSSSSVSTRPLFVARCAPRGIRAARRRGRPWRAARRRACRRGAARIRPASSTLSVASASSYLPCADCTRARRRRAIISSSSSLALSMTDLRPAAALSSSFASTCDARRDQRAERRIGRPGVFAVELVDAASCRACASLRVERVDQLLVARRGGFRLRVLRGPAYQRQPHRPPSADARMPPTM